MDAVITYVDGNDPFWKADYQKYTNVPIMDKRFRDWGTLKYLLRGIDKYMPFIDNVYLVVSHPSQVPSWADQENLRIVLHKDIIPAEFLPTFNSNPIEMHLQKDSARSICISMMTFSLLRNVRLKISSGMEKVSLDSRSIGCLSECTRRYAGILTELQERRPDLSLRARSFVLSIYAQQC